MTPQLSVCYNATMNIKIEMINEYLKHNGLTNTEFAKRIGYNRVSWQKIKSGIVPASEQFISNVERVFPGIFLPSDVTNVANNSTRPLSLCAKISRRLIRLLDKLYRKATERLITEPDGRED